MWFLITRAWKCYAFCEQIGQKTPYFVLKGCLYLYMLLYVIFNHAGLEMIRFLWANRSKNTLFCFEELLFRFLENGLPVYKSIAFFTLEHFHFIQVWMPLHSLLKQRQTNQKANFLVFCEVHHLCLWHSVFLWKRLHSSISISRIPKNNDPAAKYHMGTHYQVL